jgi:glycerol-3-phosphate dehydrogenase
MEQAVRIECDVLVVGGGVNGAGIARDAAGRGLSVVLCEKDDLASHTSSAATKLIHGGLRYLEQYEFGLVRKALIEREVLLRAAPHIMRPMRFVTPLDKGQRPAWMIRAGLFLYDHLARRDLLPGSHGANLRTHEAGAPLKSDFTRGFVYSDGFVDDARLVLLNAMDAAEKGARIFTRTVCETAQRSGEHWNARLRRADGSLVEVEARCMVNAAGPWASRFLQGVMPGPAEKSVRLIKGSHIVVKRLFEHAYSYLFQHPDGRVVFAIPYERDFTLIGTTDLEYHGDANQVAIDTAEIDYLCELANRYFKRPITPVDVVWSYSGVRPLLDDESADASDVTRDYTFEMDTDGAPMLSVFGGKLTTFRKLSEQAVDLIAPALSNRHGHWTVDACLPGGDLHGPKSSNRSVLEFDTFVDAMRRQYPWLPQRLAERYAHAYGTRIHRLLGTRTALPHMGREILPGLFAVEAEYWIEHEWATCAADMLWRRSKLGLHLPAGAAETLEAWIDEYRNGAVSAQAR